MEDKKVELNETELKNVAAGVGEISTDLLQNFGRDGDTDGTKDVDIRY